MHVCGDLGIKQKTADEVRISDWSSDVCSSDLIRRNKHGTGQGIGMTPELNNGACIAPKFVLTDPQLLTRRHRRGGDIVIIEGYPSPELRGLREQFRAGAAIAMPGDIGGEVHFGELDCHAYRTHNHRTDFPRAPRT